MRLLSKTYRVYQRIAAYQRENGKAPYLKGLAADMDMSYNSMQTIIRRLKKNGCIVGIPGKHAYEMVNPPEEEVDQRVPWKQQAITEAIELYGKGITGEEVAAIIQEKYGRYCSKNTVFNWQAKYGTKRRSKKAKPGSPWVQAQRIIQASEFQQEGLLEAAEYLDKCQQPAWMIDHAIMKAWTTGVFSKPTTEKRTRKAA